MKRAGADALGALLQRAIGARPDEIPEAALAHGRRRLLDNLGCAIAGRAAAGVAPVLRLTRARAGAEEASVWCHGVRSTLADAAMANATMARALDFCDVISPGWHPSSTDVPVALAIAENAGADGAALLAALAAGQDLAQRINRAAQARGFFYRGHDSNLLALLAGATIAARMLRLPEAAARHALGIAFQHGVGSFQSYQDRALAVRVAQGWTARAAIEATLLAADGMSGASDILDGECGLFRLYAPAEPDRTLLLSEPASWLGPEATCLKLYPSCGVTLALTDAALGLSAQRRGAAVARLRLRVSPTIRLICGAPFQPEAGPPAAIFSAAYVAASALLRGRATIAEFSDAALRSPEVAALAASAVIEEDPALSHFDACTLEAGLADGRVLTAGARDGRGWPANPASDAEVAAKFLANCEHGGLGATAASHLLRLVHDLPATRPETILRLLREPLPAVPATRW